MKTASAALITLLNSGTQFFIADLLTVTTLDGTVYRYTSADTNLVMSGHTYLSNDIRFSRSNTRSSIGAQVDSLDLVIWATSDNQLSGTGFFPAVVNGALDGARITIDRLFMATYGDTSAGSLNLFSGRVSDVHLSRSEATVQVTSDLEVLNIMLPRNVFQPGCIHTLFDADCGLTKASFAANGSTSAGATTTVIPCSLSQTSGYFDLGTVTFNSGANAGAKRTVKSYTPGRITLSYPLPTAPSAGDTLTAYPGCDKLQSTCSAKFNNLARFRGFPYVPVPESAL